MKSVSNVQVNGSRCGSCSSFLGIEVCSHVSCVHYSRLVKI